MGASAPPRKRWVPLLASREGVMSAVGTTFTLDTHQGPFDLLLLEVSAGSRRRGFETVSAVLRGPAAPLLPQGTYSLSHAQLGVVPLFIAPCCQDENEAHYEAWFSVFADAA